MDDQEWSVDFARDKNGNTPVKNQLRSIEKTNQEEFKILMENLEGVRDGLSAGASVAHLRSKEFRPETKGIWAVCVQRKGKKALRLYVYPHKDQLTLLLLNAGGKDGQQKDITLAKSLLAQYKKQSK